MRSPKNVKEAQRLASKIVSLSRFLLRISKRLSQSWISSRRLKNSPGWRMKIDFSKTKRNSCHPPPPMLPKPNTSKRLIFYLSISAKAISIVLIQEKCSELKPTYFVSWVLQDPETRYQVMEKVALVLVNVALHLWQYFQSHKIIVQTNCSIAKVLCKLELAGRMMAWSIELSKYELNYELRGII